MNSKGIDLTGKQGRAPHGDFPRGWVAWGDVGTAYLLYHLPHFPLLALQHVIQVVDLLPQPGHFLFQVGSPGEEEQKAEARRGKMHFSTQSQKEPGAWGVSMTMILSA